MNILFIIPDLQIGGAQTFLARLASYLKKNGHSVFIYTVHPDKVDNEIFNFFTADVPVINRFYFDLMKKFDAFPLVKKIIRRLINPYKFDSKKLRKFLKKNEIRIINSHMYLADLYLSRLNLPGYAKISSWHGCYNLLLDSLSVNSIDCDKRVQELRIIFEDFKHIILISERQKNAYEKLKLKLPYSFIYNGFEKPKVIKPVEFDKGGAFVFGMVARGDKTKGWAEAIEAFTILKSKIDKPVKLVLVGDSKFLRDLKRQNQDPDIIFAGATDNPLGWIYHFDVGLLPTYFPAESLPNSVIEYLAMGIPVIATRWAEIPKMIDSDKGKAGILIDLKNGKPSINQLAEAMFRLITDKQLYQDLKANTQYAFEKFSMEVCVRKYIKLFQDLVTENLSIVKS